MHKRVIKCVQTQFTECIDLINNRLYNGLSTPMNVWVINGET